MPLAVTLGAALFLREPVGWRRYLAIAIGFSGVLVIVRPGADGFNTYALWALAAVGFMVLRDLSTRQLSREIPSIFVALTTAVGITVAGGAVAAFQPWQPVSAQATGTLAAAAVFLFFGYLLFQVPVRGSIVDLYVAATLFIAANLSLGLLISTAVKTQFQAMQLTVFILLPSILLSGFMFPFDGMPRFAQWLGEVLPTTHFIRMTRGIMLREATLADLLPEVLALGTFLLFAMTAAALRFHKSLD